MEDNIRQNVEGIKQELKGVKSALANVVGVLGSISASDASSANQVIANNLLTTIDTTLDDVATESTLSGLYTILEQLLANSNLILDAIVNNYEYKEFGFNTNDVALPFSLIRRQIITAPNSSSPIFGTIQWYDLEGVVLAVQPTSLQISKFTV